MDRGTPILPAGLNPEDDRFLQRLARQIEGRGLTAPAIVFLECFRPAAFLGGQAMRVVSPFAQLARGGRDWDRLSQILEVRGSVDRLLAYLEVVPESLAERQRIDAPDDAAYVVVDCGSTTTKAVLLAHREGQYRLVGRSEAPTTVEAPTEDVMVGVRAALSQLQRRSGHPLLREDGELERARGPNHGAAALLATSSAGGGLQMVVVGLVRGMTAATAERAALGAGAIVTDVLAWNDAEDETDRIDRLRRARPDMLLLAGGTDGGATEQVVGLAEQLAAAALRPRWGDGRLPIVYAGNPDAAAGVCAALGETAEVVVADNLRPNLETENLGPVRCVLHECFLRHVMARAPGYADLQSLCSAPVVPTPAAFGAALELLAATEGDLVAVDLGGATCDVFSVRSSQVYRSVSANLGLSFSLGAVCQRAGWWRIARWLPLPLSLDDLRDRVRNKMVRPTTIPQTPEDLMVEQAAAREALRLAIEDHVQALQPLRGTRDEVTGVEALAHVEAPAEGIRWPDVRLLLGSGGPLAHAPDRGQAAAILLDACRPEGVTELAVDSVFVMPHLGVLRQTDETAAAAVLATDAIVVLGCSVCPVGRRRPAVGERMATVVVTVVDGDELDRELTLLGGALQRVPLASGRRWKLEIRPESDWDFGAGPNETVHALVRGGSMGLVLDGRGHDLPWPEAELARRDAVMAWRGAMGIDSGEATG